MRRIVLIAVLLLSGSLLHAQEFAAEGLLTVPVQSARLVPGTYLCTLESERWHGMTRLVVLQ